MKNGFSLVELSIVLVILGLLTGGILAGQSLIRAAELRSVSTEYSRYVTAAQSFRDKYFALPGDMTNAQSLWGVAHATPATCVTTLGAGTQTCNGDGNGLVNYNAAGSNEWYRFWQHLTNAGLIEGTYAGVAGAGGVSDSTLGTNVPKSKLGNAGWTAESNGTFFAGGGGYFQGNYNNYLAFGAKSGIADTIGYALKPEELWNIDTKLDDGKPGTGKILAFHYAACANAASASDLTASYALSTTTIACSALFIQAF